MTLHAGRDARTVDRMLDAVHEALVGAGVPQDDRFQRVLELEPGKFR